MQKEVKPEEFPGRYQVHGEPRINAFAQLVWIEVGCICSGFALTEYRG
jgi:hypothetical protein